MGELKVQSSSTADIMTDKINSQMEVLQLSLGFDIILLVASSPVQYRYYERISLFPTFGISVHLARAKQ